jgi:hypothetical protein
MRHTKKRPMADSATILTLWALPDDLWELVECLLDKFDPPNPEAQARPQPTEEELFSPREAPLAGGGTEIYTSSLGRRKNFRLALEVSRPAGAL